MKKLSIDIETYSEIDLAKAGVYAYSEHASFSILLLSYAYDDGPVYTVDLARGETMPKSLLNDLQDASVLKQAWNAQFERTCLVAQFKGLILDPTQWRDTQALSAWLGLPLSLDQAGEVLNLSDDLKKDKKGKALITYFSKPCKPTKANGGRTRNMPEHAPDKWGQYVAYNKQDVVTERAISLLLEPYGVHPTEQDYWAMDQEINDLGVLCDLDMARKAVAMDTHEKELLLDEAKRLTGLDNPNSVAQVKEWIETRTGLQVSSLNKSAIPSLRASTSDASVHKLLDIREGLRKTSTSKYEAMLKASCLDGRIRGLTKFYGASRTGRWAGRIVQMQNLPQNKMSDRDLDSARGFVKLGDYELLDLLWDNVSDTLSQLIRTAFVPKKGHRFIVADYSAIEARVLAWYASEDWRLSVFATHGRIYEASAEKMFNLPQGSVKKGDPMRQKGKVAELALGYGGSVGALKSMGALAMGLEEHELQPLVEAWRGANKRIVNFWYNTDSAAMGTILDGATGHLEKGAKFYREGPFLRLGLPSGRALSYYRPSVDDGRIYFWGTAQRAWAKIDTYGAKLVENIVQATARDCLAYAMLRLKNLGYRIVFHVHDEVVLEVPIGHSSAEEVARIMSEPIPWAPGMPLKADAYECEYYRKD